MSFQELVHSKALLLLGLEYRGKRKAIADLPHPLAAGDAPRTNLDGVELFNPCWSKGPNEPTNKAYIDRIVTLISREDTEKAEVSKMFF